MTASIFKRTKAAIAQRIFLIHATINNLILCKFVFENILGSKQTNTQIFGSKETKDETKGQNKH